MPIIETADNPRLAPGSSAVPTHTHNQALITMMTGICDSVEKIEPTITVVKETTAARVAVSGSEKQTFRIPFVSSASILVTQSARNNYHFTSDLADGVEPSRQKIAIFTPGNGWLMVMREIR